MASLRCFTVVDLDSQRRRRKFLYAPRRHFDFQAALALLKASLGETAVTGIESEGIIGVRDVDFVRAKRLVVARRTQERLDARAQEWARDVEAGGHAVYGLTLRDAKKSL